MPIDGTITPDDGNPQESIRADKLKVVLCAFNSEVADLLAHESALKSSLKDFYVGRRVTARPNNCGAKLLPYRDGIINYVGVGREISFGVDWFKKDGSGDFHDYGPAWYRTFIRARNISHISDKKYKTMTCYFLWNVFLKCAKIAP